MCGRYTLRTPPADFWPAEQLGLFVPRYNIAPSQEVPVVRVHRGRQELTMLRWGLVPSWAEDAKIGYRMINARSESVATKPSFRAAFQQRRCLVPADGYYEWKAVGKTKQPYFIRRADDRPFMFAGLWEIWFGPPGVRRDVPLQTCTILTTDANSLTAEVHDRMPVILSSDDHAFWLDPEFQNRQHLQSMLRPFPSDTLTMYPVTTLVNKPAHEQPECIEPLT
jgi:putative SOS response-associated peptidase YedK